MKTRIIATAMVLAACLVSSAADAGTVELAFCRDREISIEQRTIDGEATPISAIELLLADPTPEEASRGLVSFVTPGTRLISFQPTAYGAIIELSEEAVADLDDLKCELVFKQFVYTLVQFGLDKEVRVRVGGYPLSSYLAPVPQAIYAAPTEPPAKAPVGAIGLSGKRITISPGHGYYWWHEAGIWTTQRGTACGYPCEDFNVLNVATWLKKYFEGDGAYVQVVREHDKTRGNGPSGHPWWQEAAYVYLKDAGYPCSVYASSSGVCSYTGAEHLVDDIRCRGLASNMDPRGNTDVFLSIHTNAASGSAKGTTVWYCDTGEHIPWGAQSIDLCNRIGTEVVNAIQAAGEKCADGTTWGCLGGVCTRYGDLGEARIPARPAALIELGFHDNCTADAPKLHDPFFQSVAMWGEYKAVCSFLGVTPTWDMYSYEIVSHDIPISISPGQTREVHITLRNRGVLWTSAKGFKLGAVGDSDPFTTTTRYSVSTDTGPGDIYTFTLSFTAPSTPGYYTTDWRMIREGYQWFGPTVTKTVNVGMPPDTQPPSVPTNLVAVAQSPTQVNLTWTASTDNIAVAGYKVFRGGSQIGTTVSTSYSDMNCEPDRTYSYTVSAFDDAENESAQCAPVNVTTPFETDIILDEEVASYTGSWTDAVGSSPNCYGGDYKYTVTTTSETATAIWRPNIVRAGNYDVYVYYREGSNRTYYAPYTIYYDGGSQLYRINQTTNGGQWNFLGRKLFASGTAGYVKLGNNTSDTGKVVVADAVRFVYVPTTPPSAPTDGTPVANSTSAITWSWYDVSDETGYRVKDTAGATKSGDLPANTTSWQEASGLVANTQYTRRIYAFNENGESAGSVGQTRFTLAKAPSYGASGDVTIQCNCGQAKADCTAGQNIVFTFNNAFGSGPANVGQFDYKWDQNPSWDGSGGTVWSTGATLTLQAGTPGQSYYLHIRSYNNDTPKAVNPTVLNLGPYTVPSAERLLNPGFENWAGANVADNWTQYSTVGSVACYKGSSFTGTPSVFPHGGSECQRVKLDSNGERGGVYQQFSTTPGVTYTVSAWLLTRKTSTSQVQARLGVENGARTVPSSPTWSDYVTGDSNWTLKTLMLQATDTTMTVFLEGYHPTSDSSQCNVFFDDASASAGCSPPATPADGSPTADSATAITWKWSDVLGESGYRVKDTGGIDKSGNLAENTVQWTEANLTPNTQYTRRIYAFNVCGESEGSTGQTKYTLAKAGESTDGTGATGNVYCTNAIKNTWYGTGKTFTFSNPAGFGTGGLWKASKFEYKWNQSATESWSTSGTIWSSGTISLTATSGDGDYYLHVRAFNGDNVPNNAETLDYGPFKSDSTGPSAVTVTDEGSYTPSQTQLSASWTASTDSGSGLNRYEYAVGTSPTTQNIKGWTSNGTSTNALITGLSLVDGTTYYVQVRAIDNLGNPSASTSADGILVAPGVGTIAAAWSLPNNTQPFSLRNKVVTAKIGNAFWLEETNRAAAIKVVSSAPVERGNTVSVAGVLGMSGTQRALIGDVVLNSGGNTIIRPLGVNQRELLCGNWNPSTPGMTEGEGLYNIGLLVKCAGTVTYSSAADPSNKYFYFDDGSGLSSDGHAGVKVWCGSINPPSGGVVVVTGVLSSELKGGNVVPVLLIRDSADIQLP